MKPFYIDENNGRVWWAVSGLVDAEACPPTTLLSQQDFWSMIQLRDDYSRLPHNAYLCQDT